MSLQLFVTCGHPGLSVASFLNSLSLYLSLSLSRPCGSHIPSRLRPPLYGSLGQEKPGRGGCGADTSPPI